jgi:hypothetical protein
VTHMDLVRIVNIRINAALKDILEMLRLGMEAIGHASKVNVQEGRATVSGIAVLDSHMAKIEKTDMA